MKFFENKKIFQKIIIAIVTVILFAFVFSGKVHATDDDGLGRKIVKTCGELIASSWRWGNGCYT